MSESIIEKDIDLYTGGKENALRRLRNCEPKDEAYWKALALKYNRVVTELMELNEMFMLHSSNQKEVTHGMG